MITLNKIKKTKGISLQYWENPDLENPPYYTY